MIDIESDVYELVSQAVLADFPNALVVGKETRMPTKFPCVSIVEADNYTLDRTQDSSSNENHVSLLYAVNIYSNKAKGSKSECKAILAIVDDLLIRKGFARTSCVPISLDDATKFRYAVRYMAVADKRKTIYRR